MFGCGLFSVSSFSGLLPTEAGGRSAAVDDGSGAAGVSRSSWLCRRW